MKHDLDALLLEVLKKFDTLPKRVEISWVDLDNVDKENFDENNHWAMCLLGHTEIAFIGLHPKLMRAPKYVILYLIFHELLHVRLPPHKGVCHHKAFRTAEKLWPDYTRANNWLEKTGI